LQISMRNFRNESTPNFATWAADTSHTFLLDYCSSAQHQLPFCEGEVLGNGEKRRGEGKYFSVSPIGMLSDRKIFFSESPVGKREREKERKREREKEKKTERERVK